MEIGFDGRITAVGLDAQAGGETVAAPGFVDLQVNGFGGVDVRDADPAEIVRVARELHTHGVTAFAPTGYSMDLDGYVAFVRAVVEARAAQPSSGHARILAPHLEGPVLSPRWAGAHDPSHLVAPGALVLERLVGAGPIGMMTLAPELDGARAVVRALRHSGVVVAAGHTDATAEQMIAAEGWGIAMVTHAFNAQRRFTARDPGPAVAAMLSARMVVGLIADLVHLAPATLDLAMRVAPGRVAIVGDTIAPAGTSLRSWGRGAGRVVVRDGVATRRLAPDHADSGPAARGPVLSGSVVAIDAAVRNLVSVGIDPAAALSAASTVPARVAGLGPHDLRVGSVADLVVLDRDLVVERTLVGGIERSG